jgi:adenylate cyclase
MLSLWVSNKNGSERFTHAAGPLELGRGPQEGSVARKVLDDQTVSRNQVRIEQRGDDRIYLRNLSPRVAIALADGTRIEPLAEAELALPVRLHMGSTLVEVDTHSSIEQQRGTFYQSIDAPLSVDSWHRPAGVTIVGRDPSPAELARWFEALVGIQKATASSPDFFTDVARAVVELIGLDRGMVLVRGNGKWVPVAVHSADADRDEGDFSHAILDRVLRERLTFFQQEMPTSSSLAGVTAVVAAPILDEAQTVTGAVYGVRRRHDASGEIRPIEAQLVQVLAATVAAGLARLDSEARAARQRVQFEQFFTPDLAAELDRDPTLLDGREREITALFADIRGFSGAAERAGPRVACDLIREIMDCLTTQVRLEQGVVVDYQGDGLLAMWNAPVEQHDHAARACRAALAMQAQLPTLAARWRDRLGCELGVGVGINSGMALVGNTGSRSKFKYGPLGHTVNLASRVEGATKQMGVRVLATGSTRALMGDGFATRRLCKVRVLGISGEVDLYEVADRAADAEWAARRDAYERALALHEQKRWGEACHVLFPLLPARHDAPGAAYDIPTVALLARALDCLKQKPSQFDPVLELSSK